MRSNLRKLVKFRMRLYTFVVITICVTYTYSECGTVPCDISDETNLQAKSNISNDVTNDELQDIFIDDVQEDGAVDNYYNISVIDGKNVTFCGNITCSDKGRGCESYGVCRCLVGSWGNACDQDRDECSAPESPCGGRAHCINTPGSFECVCLEGWMGDHCVIRNISVALECLPGWTGNACDKDINECANSSDVCPGDHNTCRNVRGGFRCRCISGWTGENCSEDIDECLHNPCLQSGTCSNSPGSYNCYCTDGFTGYNCQNDTDECASNPCLNSGTCTNSIGSFSCSCPIGWSGDICKDDFDECKNDPCLHSGSCINTHGSFSCVCANNLNGSLCQNDIDECLLSPCVNGGTCVNNNGSFACLCPSSWQGQTCHEDLDECQNKSCGLNKLCANTQGSFTCSCPIGFQGLTCTEDVDECIRKPCLNNGTCVNTNGSFFCACSDELSGILCEYVTNGTRVEGHTLASIITPTSIRSTLQDIIPTTTVYQYDESTSNDHVNIALIVGATIGSLVAAGGVFLIAVFVMRYKWKQEHGNNLVGDSHEPSLHQKANLKQMLQPDDGQRFQEVIMKTRFSWGNIYPRDK